MQAWPAIGEPCLKASRVQSDTGVIVIVARNATWRIRRPATGSDFAQDALRAHENIGKFSLCCYGRV